MRYIATFLLASLLLVSAVAMVSVVPALDGEVQGFEVKRPSWPASWAEVKANYFNADRLLFTLGIIRKPEFVKFGQPGWLFTGDQYSLVYTDATGALNYRLDELREIHRTRQAWGQYFASQGIDYRVQVAANKHSIYSEQLADKPKGDTRLDAFVSLQVPQDEYLVNSVPYLLARKAHGPELYLQTDSHWNAMGAYYAYQQLIEGLPGDITLTPAPDINNFTVTQGGDLARLLGVERLLRDYNIPAQRVPVTGRYFDTGEQHYVGPSYPVGSLERAQVFTTPGALNSQRVLWLHDSFGSALSPYIHKTFKEVLHQSYFEVLDDSKKLIDMVRRFKPNIVLVTHAERHLGEELFRNGPRAIAELSAAENYPHVLWQFTPESAGAKNMQPLGDSVYSATNNDPIIETPELEACEDYCLLRVAIDVEQRTPMQLFYREKRGQGFSPQRVYTRILSPGPNSVLLRIPAEHVALGMRLDPVAYQGEFLLNQVELLSD
ncbi:alginate O-acetyltransferase AlgX-related protein [Gilvimarinus agarilyticus]|uniref:alginate O-acetyltransferase AlgX-related protein n=1 Tax=Gilvimarinus agarilyticus TaxID=679259 RepID=UPI0005A0967F|nr:hypothetical protein [Gilvimarinus agarilyticus]